MTTLILIFNFMELKGKIEVEYWFKKLKNNSDWRISNTKQSSKDISYQEEEYSIPSTLFKTLKKSVINEKKEYAYLLSAFHIVLAKIYSKETTVVRQLFSESCYDCPFYSKLEFNSITNGKEVVSEVTKDLQVSLKHFPYDSNLVKSKLKSNKIEFTNSNEVNLFFGLPESEFSSSKEGHLQLYFQPGEKITVRFNKGFLSKGFIDNLIDMLWLVYNQLTNDLDIKLNEIKYLSDEKVEIFNAENINTFKDFKFISIIDRLIEFSDLKSNNIALITNNKEFSYKELAINIKNLASELKKSGINKGDIIGVFGDRDEEIVFSILAILYLGAVYLPLDKQLPKERIDFIIKDAGISKILTNNSETSIFNSNSEVINVSTLNEIHNNDLTYCSPDQNDTAYIMYTSGSTGQPKGVSVSHSNLHNFLSSMKETFSSEEGPDVFYSMTGHSFDISLLEIFWPISYGQTLWLSEDTLRLDKALINNNNEDSPNAFDWSIYFFSSYNHYSDEKDKYGYIKDVTKLADKKGFTAVWTPERHFNDFGGLFPNPSVLSSALAVLTDNIQLRAGSVVSPLHSTTRIVEEWSLVDNLSNGRVGMALASGWHPNDFILKPENYSDRKLILEQQVEEMRTLWSGGSLKMKNGEGKEIDVITFPLPIQQEIPLWITSAGNPETFAQAGKLGVNILTHMLGQDVEVLKQNIELYFHELKKAGHDPKKKVISIMLHTFIADSIEEAINHAKKPFCEYLRSSLSLAGSLIGLSKEQMEKLGENEIEKVLETIFYRYYKSTSLIGTNESIKPLLKELKDIGITEISCLLDFGIQKANVINSINKIGDIIKPSAKKENLNNSLFPTIFQSTPSKLSMMLSEQENTEFFKNLKIILLGGEPVRKEVVDRLKSSSDARILNMYGPTETTIWSTIFEYGALVSKELIIGKPIANTQVYILDEENKKCAPYVWGTLFIGGKGVAKGYVNRPEMTKSKFIINPYGDDLIYNTGDVVRWTDLGNIEFQGRNDSQVKINGNRIELGDIEANISVIKEVDFPIVLVNDKKIIAFYSGIEMEETALISILKEKLPRYMIPEKFIFISDVPLMPNGKIDRLGLLSSVDESTILCEEPEEGIEQNIAKYWQELLTLDKSIGRNNNFFSLGGNSINATIMLSKIGEIYNVNIEINKFFSEPTIANLKNEIEEGKKNSFEIIPAKHAGGRTELSYAQQRLWLFESIYKDTSTYNMPMAYTVKGKLNLNAFIKAFKYVTKKHDSFNTVFSVESGKVWQEILDEKEPIFEYIDLSDIPAEKEVIDLANNEVINPFKIKGERLYRAKLIRVKKDEYVFLFTIHHIISDGWSIVVIVNDIFEGYHKMLNGTAISTNSKNEINYFDYSIWQNSNVKLRDNSEHVSFFKNKFNNEVPELELPYDNDKSLNSGFQGRNLFFELEAGLIDKLHETAKQKGTTIFQVFLMAMFILNHKISGQEDIILGTPWAGRDRKELKNIVGFFINTLVFRLNLNSNMKIDEVLNHLKQEFIEVYKHREYPSDKITEILDGKRDWSSKPLVVSGITVEAFDIIRSEKDTDNVELEIFPQEYSVSTNDLWFFIDMVNNKSTLRVSYNKDLFKKETIKKYVNSYIIILNQISNDTNISLSEIEIEQFDQFLDVDIDLNFDI